VYNTGDSFVHIVIMPFVFWLGLLATLEGEGGSGEEILDGEVKE
jgi:hypothetical protein